MSHSAPARPTVEPFFDKDTATFTYDVYDAGCGSAAIIDPVLAYDAATVRTSTRSHAVLAFVRTHALHVEWILETHAHADHLSVAAYLREALNANVAIGRGITKVQERFKALFNLKPEFATDGSQFDRLLDDGDTLQIGTLQAHALATPEHTDDSLTYLIGDAAFVGDTVFAPDTGTTRCDLPGGDASKLYRSIPSQLLVVGRDPAVPLPRLSASGVCMSLVSGAYVPRVDFPRACLVTPTCSWASVHVWAMAAPAATMSAAGYSMAALASGALFWLGLAGLGVGSPEAFWFVPAMVAGLLIHRAVAKP